MGDELVVGSAGSADFYPRRVEEHHPSIFGSLKKFEDNLAIHRAYFDTHHWLFVRTPKAVGEKRRTNQALNQNRLP